MRKRLQILNYIFYIILQLFAFSAKGYADIIERSRGFFANKCYLHLAQLDCPSSKDFCIINLFAGPNRLSFKTSFRDAKSQVGGSRIRDFKIKLVSRHGSTEADLLKMEHPESSKERIFDQYGFAHEVPCIEE